MGKATRRKQADAQLKLAPYQKALDTKSTVRKVKDKAENLRKALEWFDGFRSQYGMFEQRDLSNFNVLSFNEHNIRVALVRFMYCKYAVPDFLLKYFVRNVRTNVVSPLRWFLQITTGVSFYKANKELFTKKEAHLYLNASSHRNPYENVIWARCKARELRVDISSILCKNPVINQNITSKIWRDFIDFIVRYQDRKITRDRLSDLIDYISRQPAGFSLAGRTWDSLVRVSKRWHRNSRWSSYAQPYMQWNRAGKLINAEFEINEVLWAFREILDSNDLLDESIAQDHCVVTYKDSCAGGHRRIVSMSQGNKRHLTIEVVHDSIVQIRGKYNRRADHDDMAIIRKWAQKFGLRVNCR